jgi:transglycosylase-like protein with SLT domain
LPAVAGGGLVAVAAAVAVCVAALSGARGGTSDPPAGQAGTAVTGRLAWSAVPSATVPSAAVPSATGSTGDPATTASSTGKRHGSAPSLTGQTSTRLVVPDVIASVPGGVTKADLARIARISGVRAVLAIDGARITVNRKQLTVLAAPEGALRPWTPPATAANGQVWASFRAGQLITTAKAAARAQLVSGSDYPVRAATNTRITQGGTALLGVAGVDGVVSAAEGRKLGLVRNVAVLVNAPAVDVTTLMTRVRAALGARAQVIRLVPVRVSTALPVDTKPPTGRPTSYLELFQESAAQYCPGLSWTVLAAIGQIESGDGQNMGPSTAGALGPMQFLPSTWKTWGITGFGDTGKPDIMNPFDAVPSAARLLCADGAAAGGAGLRQAIFDYNHANWYVDEVLTLAAEYAREFP